MYIIAFTHLGNDNTYAAMPVRLRMNVIGNPGVPKTDFELVCLVASAMNGCDLCIKMHEKILTDYGLSKGAIQSAVRTAAVIYAAALGVEGSF